MLNISRVVASALGSACTVLLLSLTLFAASASAQTTDVVGVRAQGMGGAFTAVADDASGGWWNPAGLAGGPLFNGLVEFDRPNTSLSQSVRGVAISYPALGVMYYRLPLSQIRLSVSSTGSTPSDRQDEEAALSLYGATFGQSLGNHLVLASTLKLLHAGDTNVGLDFGAMASFGLARFGVTVRDVTKPTFTDGPLVFTVERTARLGAALSSGRRGVIGSATLSFDADLTTTHDPLRGEQRDIAFGIETWTAKRNIGFRGGLTSNQAGDEPVRFSGGVSVAVRSGTFVDAFISGGHDEARQGWGLALRVTF